MGAFSDTFGLPLDELSEVDVVGITSGVVDGAVNDAVDDMVDDVVDDVNDDEDMDEVVDLDDVVESTVEDVNKINEEAVVTLAGVVEDEADVLMVYVNSSN